MITKKTYQTPRNTVVQMQGVQPLLLEGSNNENITPGEGFGPKKAREEVQIIGSYGW
ncbi:MAG: hypothetical protein KBT39_03965 [Bacteroidales bacterium]|nr:hypothetical protein [Bacteroidales bacterium]